MAYTFNTELKSIASAYAQLIGARVSSRTIGTEIEENPYYPSLLALSDTFKRYKIHNEAFLLNAQEFDTVAIETPFVAFMKIPEIGTDFVLVTDVTEQTVSYQHKGNKKQIVSKKDFVQSYKDIIWLAETSEQSGDTEYAKKKQVERIKTNKKIVNIVFAGIIFLLVILANIPSGAFIPFSIITIIKMFGFSTASLLLIYEIDKNNAFVKNICSVGIKTDCDAVLSSKAAKIMGISWGEIGFFYFASTLLGLLLPNIPFEIKATCLAIANVFAAPYIIFSIYYQWRVVRQWCPLCLAVQFTLAAELLWSMVFIWGGPIVNILTPVVLLALFFCTIAPIILWYTLKPILTKAQDHDLYKPAYKRLQYNPEIFNSLLQQQEKYPDGWQQVGIDIGNPNASNTIIKICNPYCKPCEKSHVELEDIIKRNKDIKLKIIYITRNTELDKGSIIVKHLLAIAAEGNINKTQKALDDWYLNVSKDYDTFLAKYPINGELYEQGVKIEAMSAWCDKAHVTHTPTIFVNGYRLPENYNVEELKYIL
ncbi:vitamin K epoxide reductase family protein [Emticicia fontis]